MNSQNQTSSLLPAEDDEEVIIGSENAGDLEEGTEIGGGDGNGEAGLCKIEFQFEESDEEEEDAKGATQGDKLVTTSAYLRKYRLKRALKLQPPE